MDSERTAAPNARRSTAAAIILGLAFSGFFDGILLHQVLQWHHFLSLVPGETYRDLRVQVYADGLFHVVVYCIAAIGLIMLVRARRELDRPGAGRRFVGGAVLGFGVWNIADVGFFHWVLKIHRIRVNVSNPLAYDLAWFFGLGVLVAALGWWILQHRDGKSPGDGLRGRTVAATLAAGLALAVPIANIPGRDGNTLVVFRPGVGAAGAINAIVLAKAGIVALDSEGGYAVIRMGQDGSKTPLYRAGALLITRSPLLAGCLAFTQAT
jgi:uncharacterized membrane protein